MIECVIELKSTNQLWDIIRDLKKQNVVSSEDFYFIYEPPIMTYDDDLNINYMRNKRVKFYFKDEKYATYLRLLYT